MLGNPAGRHARGSWSVRRSSGRRCALAVAAAEVDAPVVAVDRVEPGGEDQDVEFVQRPVRGDDAFLGDLR